MSQQPIAFRVVASVYCPPCGTAQPGAVAVFDGFRLSCGGCRTRILDTAAALELARAPRRPRNVPTRHSF